MLSKIRDSSAYSKDILPLNCVGQDRWIMQWQNKCLYERGSLSNEKTGLYLIECFDRMRQ